MDNHLFFSLVRFFSNSTLSNWIALRNTFVTICNVIDSIRHWPNMVRPRLYLLVAIPTMSFIEVAPMTNSVTVVKLVEKRSINGMAMHWQSFITSKNGRSVQTASAEGCRCEPQPESVPLT